MTTAPAPNHFSGGRPLSGRSDLIVRAMRPDDVETLALLEGRVEESPWSAGNFLDSLNTGHLCLVVQSASASASEAGLAAWAVASLVLDESELLIIGTAPSMHDLCFQHVGNKINITISGRINLSKSQLLDFPCL